MMVYFLAVSILLLPIVTASDDDFWGKVDMIYDHLSDPEDVPTKATYDDLSDPEELPTLGTTSEDYLEEPMPDYPQMNPSSNENEETPLKCKGRWTRNFRAKVVTLRPEIVENFRQSLIIVESSLKNISRKILEDKLQAMGNTHKWNQLRNYQVDKYSKYWANVCVTFWDKPPDRTHRVSCIVSRSYANNKRRILYLRRTKHYFDLLFCRCHTFLSNSKIPLITSEAFLINKGNNNEFFIFEENQSQGRLSIKGFKDGITLPGTSAPENHRKLSGKFRWKLVTLDAHEIERFNQALTINTSYPQNVSMEELEEKLLELEDIHEWPDLRKYDHDNYSRYWAKVCVYFWGKKLDSSHRQACVLAPSLENRRVRRLFLHGRTKFFDLLRCKCHSYIINYKTPVSHVDTFLIHQSSANEFFVFEQQATSHCQFTLFIKDFKGGITLPDPENLN